MNRQPWMDRIPLDAGFEKARRTTDEVVEGLKLDEQDQIERGYKGDSLDLFCRRQRARLSSKLQRSVTRVLKARDEDEVFESRK